MVSHITGRQRKMTPSFRASVLYVEFVCITCMGIVVLESRFAARDPTKEEERERGREKGGKRNRISVEKREHAGTTSPIIRPAVLPPSARLEQNARICSVFHLSVSVSCIAAPLLVAVLLLRI